MVVEVEDAVRVQMNSTSEEAILEEVKEWVEDPFYSRTIETKYFKLAKTY